MSDDPEFSRRSFLRGLGAAMAASTAPKDVIEAAAAAVGQELHPLARDLATNVWHLHEPYYAHYPNNFRDLRAEVVQYLTDLPKKPLLNP
jgi:TAT (twin-arginine translocation) pathway signal sequence